MNYQDVRENKKELSQSKIVNRMKKLDENWKVINSHHLEKSFTFDSFKKTMLFVNDVARLAEFMNHHPDICISYKSAIVQIFTHNIEGLSDADFDLASRIDKL